MGYHKGSPHILTAEIDRALVQHVKDIAVRFHGMTCDKVKSLAYQLAKDNGVSIPPSCESNRCAGKSWLQEFMTRNCLLVRKPKPTSLSRATAFNTVTCKLFYDNLSLCME